MAIITQYCGSPYKNIMLISRLHCHYTNSFLYFYKKNNFEHNLTNSFYTLYIRIIQNIVFTPYIFLNLFRKLYNFQMIVVWLILK